MDLTNLSYKGEGLNSIIVANIKVIVTTQVLRLLLLNVNSSDILATA